MKQLSSSKYFNSQKTRIFSSKLKLSSPSRVPSVISPSVNLELFTLHQLLEVLNHHYHPHFPNSNNTTVKDSPNPRPNLKLANKLDLSLSVEKIEKENFHTILQSLTKPQLLEILEEAAIVHPKILHTIVSMIDVDPSHRKLFVRSLGPKTTAESLHNFFSRYGVVEEARVIFDKATGNSKGFGFVTFKDVESFLLALKKPSKKIEGFVSFSSVCVDPESISKDNGSGGGSNPNAEDDELKRKILLVNVPVEMSSETLLDFFGKYGEIQEGPWGFDMATGKSRGFAYLLYKNEESAKAASAERFKTVDGFNLVCKMGAKKRGKNRKIQLDMVQSLPMPLRVLVLPVFYYYFYSYFRGVSTYNCYQSEFAMRSGGGGGGGGQCWTEGIEGIEGIEGPSSSSTMSTTVTYIVGGAHSGIAGASTSGN